MDTFDAIKARRSVKHYDPNHKMTKEEIDQMVTILDGIFTEYQEKTDD